ncbi:MbtH family protein [Entomohabitans teleogrylli]|uniref:MbtH family protein n=1 Tax=Entomohabitans teleogrylli TaxID=1384589 RepID=UPI00073D417B|nr:MbtH family NRPS accessory protein [Entomohabitans teleogrylli]
MEYSNPFDDPQGQFLILENDRHQFSLWPALCVLPAGWKAVFGPQPQAECFNWLDAQWQTLTPSCFSRSNRQ